MCIIHVVRDIIFLFLIQALHLTSVTVLFSNDISSYIAHAKPKDKQQLYVIKSFSLFQQFVVGISSDWKRILLSGEAG